MIARPVPSHRRLEAFEWKGPPERIDAGDINDDERRVITSFALRRLEKARNEMDFAGFGTDASEKSL
jgi:hypothetical protein